MMRALNTSATGMVAQQFNLDVISNNLANVNTTAFKEQRAEFQDLIYQTLRASGAQTSANSQQPVPLQIGMGVMYSSIATGTRQGAPQSTGDPLNLMIRGGGYFAVETPAGVAYTRDGSFKTDGEGRIVTSDGYLLQPNVTIPPGSSAISISANGVLTYIEPGNTDPTVGETIQVSTFTNPAGLTRIGQNLYQAGGASGAPNTGNPGEAGRGEISSGFLEASNVQVVEEMVRMIMAQRAYEINSKAVQTSDEMLGILNNLKR